MKKVKPGDPLEIRAADWNQFVDAAEFVKGVGQERQVGLNQRQHGLIVSLVPVHGGDDQGTSRIVGAVSMVAVGDGVATMLENARVVSERPKMTQVHFGQLFLLGLSGLLPALAGHLDHVLRECPARLLE